MRVENIRTIRVPKEPCIWVVTIDDTASVNVEELKELENILRLHSKAPVISKHKSTEFDVKTIQSLIDSLDEDDRAGLTLDYCDQCGANIHDCLCIPYC